MQHELFSGEPSYIADRNCNSFVSGGNLPAHSGTVVGINLNQPPCGNSFPRLVSVLKVNITNCNGRNEKQLEAGDQTTPEVEFLLQKVTWGARAPPWDIQSPANKNNSQCSILSPQKQQQKQQAHHQNEHKNFYSSVAASEAGTRSSDGDVADVTQGDARDSWDCKGSKYLYSHGLKYGNRPSQCDESNCCLQTLHPYTNPHDKGDYCSIPSYNIDQVGNQPRYVTELRLNLSRPHGCYSSRRSSTSLDPVEADDQDGSQGDQEEEEEEEEEDCGPVKAILCRAVAGETDAEDKVAYSTTEGTETVPVEEQDSSIHGNSWRISSDTSHSIRERVTEKPKCSTKSSGRSISFETNSNRQCNKGDKHVKIVPRKPVGDLRRWRSIDPKADVKTVSRLLQQLSLPNLRSILRVDNPVYESDLTGDDCSQTSTSTTTTTGTCTLSHSSRSRSDEEQDTCPTLLGCTSIAKTVILRIGKTSRGTQSTQLERVKVLRDMEIQTVNLNATKRVSPPEQGRSIPAKNFQEPTMWHAPSRPTQRTQCNVVYSDGVIKSAQKDLFPSANSIKNLDHDQAKDVYSATSSVTSCNSPSSFLVFTQMNVNTTERSSNWRSVSAVGSPSNDVIGREPTVQSGDICDYGGNKAIRSVFKDRLSASSHPVSVIGRSVGKYSEGPKVALKENPHRNPKTNAVIRLASDSDETNELFVVEKDRSNLVPVISTSLVRTQAPRQSLEGGVEQTNRKCLTIQQSQLVSKIEQTQSSLSRENATTISERSVSKLRSNEDLTSRLENLNKDCSNIQESCTSKPLSLGFIPVKNLKPFYKVVCEASQASEHRSLSSKSDSQGLTSTTGSCSSCSCCSGSSTPNCQEAHQSRENPQGKQFQTETGPPTLPAKRPLVEKTDKKQGCPVLTRSSPKAKTDVGKCPVASHDAEYRRSNLENLFNQVTEKEKRSILQRWLLEQVAHSSKQIRDHSQEVSRNQPIRSRMSGSCKSSREAQMTTEVTDSDVSSSGYRTNGISSSCTSEVYRKEWTVKKGDHWMTNQGRRSWRPEGGQVKDSSKAQSFRKVTESASCIPSRVQSVPRRMSTSPRLGLRMTAQGRSEHDCPRVHTSMDGRRVGCRTKAQQTSPPQLGSALMTEGDRWMTLTQPESSGRNFFPEDRFHGQYASKSIPPEVVKSYEGAVSSRRLSTVEREYSMAGSRNAGLVPHRQVVSGSSGQVRYLPSSMSTSGSVLRRGDTPGNRLERSQGQDTNEKVYELSPQDDIVKSHLNSADRRIKAVGNKNGCQIQITGPITTLVETPLAMSTRSSLTGRPRTSFQCHIAGPTGEKVNKCVNMLKDTFPRSFIRTCWRA